MVFKSLKDFIHSSRLNHLSLYNVQGLQQGILSQSDIKHLILYQATEASADSSLVEDLNSIPDSDSEEEESQLGICPLESLETDMGMTIAEHAKLFRVYSHSSGAEHHLLDGVMFPFLSRLRLYHSRIDTREFNIMVNEILLNTPVLEDLFIYNAGKLSIQFRPEGSVLPLRYNHLTRLRSFSLGASAPHYKQMETLECLCADKPPPSLREVVIDIMIDLRHGLLNGVRDAERYISWLGLHRTDAFLRRPGFEGVKKFVVRIGMAMDIFQPEDLDRESVDGIVTPWRDTVRKAITGLLEMKYQGVNVQLEL
ncbi:hypothetical protein JR316_0012591 [Psilocybe cubensis]|nr:hypothetical protein JR316_0012591 [Psilocybe cubensis]KAH9475480.1 hypothetical protein JR316_0012591 [Psilocybe cubensis]